MKDLHQLPKFRDTISSIYLEHGKVDQHEKAIAFHDKEGKVPIPAASVSVLILGPGTSITHAAMKALADNNTLVIWSGEEGVRFYAHGMGGTRSSSSLLLQAKLACDDASRLEVVKRMYQIRFNEELPLDITIEQLRGMEGVRVRNTYKEMSQETGVIWQGRNYDRSNWHSGDPVNKALSAANSCLYGLCHAAILSLGLSPAIGFIHTGKQLSFVYDIADLYKTEITIPIAFQVAKENAPGVERTSRLKCRDAFKETKLLHRVVFDIKRVLGQEKLEEIKFEPDEDPAMPAPLWSPEDEN